MYYIEIDFARDNKYLMVVLFLSLLVSLYCSAYCLWYQIRVYDHQHYGYRDTCTNFINQIITLVNHISFCSTLQSLHYLI